MTPRQRKRICLILEGTYPYLKGGVSVWTHELIQGSPQHDFVIVALSDRDRSPRDYKFSLPKNVVQVVNINLNKPRKAPGFFHRWRARASVRAAADAFRRAFDRARADDFSALPSLVRQIEASPLEESDLLNNPEVWSLISDMYALSGGDDSIARFFWVWETMARGVVRLIRAPLPDADVYHAAATGYAGLVGCLAKARHGKPLVISEHGLYLQERQMEVAFQDELQSGQRRAVEAFFQGLSKWAYRSADQVTSLSEFIRHHQIEMGAEPKKTRIIPNGIDIARFAAVPRRPHEGFRVGLVGRVALVKDIKLLIMAAAELVPSIPDLSVAVIGPSEDPVYERECRALVASMGLQNVVHFEGLKDPRDCYADLDLLVVCSLKEVQPLTILEAMASGVPMVATRSGGIPEMLSGIGQVFPPRDLHQLVRVIRRVHDDAALRRRMIDAARERVKRYDVAETLARFDALYKEVGWPASV